MSLLFMLNLNLLFYNVQKLRWSRETCCSLQIREEEWDGERWIQDSWELWWPVERFDRFFTICSILQASKSHVLHLLVHPHLFANNCYLNSVHNETDSIHMLNIIANNSYTPTQLNLYWIVIIFVLIHYSVLLNLKQNLNI